MTATLDDRRLVKTSKYLSRHLRHQPERRGRHHVHLSSDRETARRVGARHGKPVVFDVPARRMHAGGHTFFVSDNGVWLTDEVPPGYLDADTSA